MNLLIVTNVDPWVRSVSTVHRYAGAGRALGHDVAIYGEPKGELPGLPFTTRFQDADIVLFVVQVSWDFPDMPHLARLLDGVPRQRRIAVDLWGRVNDTIRLEHDFNHLEKLDGHAGWEWEEALKAVSGTILQPSLAPLRPDVGSFLFHAFDPGAVVRPHKTAREAAAAWQAKTCGAMYVGSNWQRWEQVRRFLESYAPVCGKAGGVTLVGWDWDAPPKWAVEMGIKGIDTDPDLLARLGVEVRSGVRFDEVVETLSAARFAPVFHRPLFRHLGFVTNRTFETFYADTIPLLMLPRDFVAAIYGEPALALVPGDDVADHVDRVLTRPETYWEAVLETRAHLARHHSYETRFGQLASIVRSARSGAHP